MVGVVVGILVVLAAGALIYFRSSNAALSVTSVEVIPSPRLAGCNSSIDLAGVIHTNGGAGGVDYEWVRSDGRDAGGVLHVDIPLRQKSTVIHLDWAVRGTGTLNASAALRILAPNQVPSARGAFAYRCP
jgi:hypothetical protein